ncbi:hypothetical protein RJ640_024363 [Escallonia rubra]|uniref:WAT1-related protein n=1 Tax=Escallonia rubra TaxID=112253 RepID=A0AA88RQA4_9ASTE|nr:hypothetical protein RJ640_024363 [Escallonia rubra]
MSRGRFCYREVLPFTAMFLVECTNTGLSTIFKAATDKGLDYHVFMVYSYAISTLVLIPMAFIFHRFSAQLLGYRGIELSSPTMGSAMSNLTPACTFILAIVFRMEKLFLRRLSSQAKIFGTLVSIGGAFVVILYEGPAVIRSASPSITTNALESSTQSNWAIGGALLAADYILISVWYILQAQFVRLYPAEIMVVFFYSLSLTIVSTPVCFFLQPNLDAWKIKADIGLAAILYSGIVGSSFGITVHTWGLHVKGPVYVALFRPLSIAIAAIMSVIFLGDTLYLGSVLGAILISFGFYVVMWAKTQEDMSEETEDSGTEQPEATEQVPLLKGYVKPSNDELANNGSA